jgi:hypothetical protein
MQDDSKSNLIELTKGQFAIVDAADYAMLSKITWQSRWNPSTLSYYAQTTLYPGGRKGQHTVQMHRFLLGLEPRDGKVVDHRDGNTLDNRRSNLRVATVGQNGKNRELNSNSTSGLKGVSWTPKLGRWKAQIQSNGKGIFLGYFWDKLDAHAAYCEAATRLHGDFARTQ